MKLIHHNIPTASETRKEAERNAENPMYAQASAVTDSIRDACYDGRFGVVGFGCLHPDVEEALTELGYTISRFELSTTGEHYSITW